MGSPPPPSISDDDDEDDGDDDDDDGFDSPNSSLRDGEILRVVKIIISPRVRMSLGFHSQTHSAIVYEQPRTRWT